MLFHRFEFNTVHIICSDTDNTDGSYDKEERSTVNSNTKEEEGEDYTSKSSLEILRADLALATDLVNNPTEETKLNISEMIQLKLLIANQQATIDTLSSKLHNLEILNTRRFDEEQSKVVKLEKENHTITKRLGECQEKLHKSQQQQRLIATSYTNYQRRFSTGTATTVGSKSSSDTSSSGAITL